MASVSLCASCKDRYISCHSSCDKYQNWRTSMLQEKQRICKLKDLDQKFNRIPWYKDGRFST